MNDGMTLIGDTLASEFASINDLGEILVVLIRLMLAALLGGLLGLERESQGKAPAFARTCWFAWVRPCSS